MDPPRHRCAHPSLTGAALLALESRSRRAPKPSGLVAPPSLRCRPDRNREHSPCRGATTSSWRADDGDNLDDPPSRGGAFREGRICCRAARTPRRPSSRSLTGSKRSSFSTARIRRSRGGMTGRRRSGSTSPRTLRGSRCRPSMSPPEPAEPSIRRSSCSESALGDPRGCTDPAARSTAVEGGLSRDRFPAHRDLAHATAGSKVESGDSAGSQCPR